VLWGVAFPLLSELVRGEKITVGAPYFNFFLRVLGLPLLLLMGIGPLVAWRRTSLRALGASLVGPAIFALACGIALVAFGAGSSPPGLVAYTFCAFVLGAIALEFIRGTRARRALDRSSWPAAFSSLVGRNRRRYGGYIVHAAIVLLALGIAGGAYGSTKVQKLEPGQTMRIGGYDLRYLGSVVRNAPNRTEIRARLAVSRGGQSLGTYLAGKNNYPVEGEVSNEVGIRTDWLRAQDLFLIGDQFNNDGSVVIKALVNPLVDLIWLAGFVFLLGSLIAMWPDEREQRRLARRGAPVPAT
jgi:cytochrome c-type biogenesis protein CcmF